MTRRSFLVALGVFALLVLAGVASLWILLRYEPRYYGRLLPGTEKERLERSTAFLRESTAFISSVNGEKTWYGRFTDEQVNCYLAEGFIRQGLADKLLPEGISEPRIVFEPERVRLAFRCRRGLLNTVVSVSLRVWLPSNEPNALCLQLESIKAGLLPLSAQWLLEQFADSARQNSIEVNWYRHEGLPVALLRFQADKAKPTLAMEAIQVEQGTITIQGRTIDPRAVAVTP